MGKKTDYQVGIGGDATGLKKATDQAAGYLGNLRKNAGKSFEGLKSSIFDVRSALTGLVAGFSIKAVIDSTIEAEKAAKLLNQTLAATGRQSEFTADQLLETASALQNVSTFGDEAITDVERLLLTFKRIGQPIFAQTTASVLDLSEALGVDLKAATLLVGRALDDPIKGVQNLRSAGVQLSTAQVTLITRLVRSGKLLEAQQIILDELQKKYKGAASAAADTFGGALTQLKNAAGDLLEGSGGNLTDAKESIQELTAELQKPETKQAFAIFVGGVITAVGWLAKFVVKASDAAKAVGEFAARMTGAVGDEDIDKRLEAINARIEKIRDSAENGESAWRSFQNSLGEDNESAKARNASGDAYSARAELQRLERERALLQARAHALAGLTASSAPKTAGAGSTGATKPNFVDVQAQAEAQQAALKASGTLLADYIKRTQAQLDYSYEQNLLSFKDYYARRAALETKALDQQIAEQRAALAVLNQQISEKSANGEDTTKDAGQRAEQIAQITVLERQRGDVAVKAAQDQAKAELELSDQLAEVRERLLQIQGDSGAAQTSALERQYRDLVKRLKVEGDADGQALVKKLFDAQVAKVQLDDIQQQYDRVLQDMARQEESLQLNIDSGLISERQGRREIIELHQKTAAQLQDLIPQMQALAQATGDPDAIERLKDTELELKKLGQAASELGDTLADAISGGIESGFQALADGSGWKGALKSFFTAVGNSIQQQLSKDAADAVGSFVKSIFSSAASSGGGGSAGGGGFLSSVGSFLSSFFHAGGLVGEPGAASRSVPAIAFANAPRYHNGGIAGLQPDEVPAVLQKGERVLTKEQQRGVGGITVPVTIVTQDANSFRRSAGEVQAQIGQAVANAVKRNR